MDRSNKQSASRIAAGLVLATLLAIGQAHAETVAGELTRVGEDIARAQAELKKAELLNQIAQKNADTNRINKSGETHDADLVVRSIESFDGRARAEFVSTGGSVSVATVGDQVNGWKVKSITDNAVVLSKGRNIRRLSVGYVPPSPVTATPGSAGGMPSAVPLMR